MSRHRYGGYGRSTSHEIKENYLGFPQGIHSEELRQIGKKQAEKFGVTFVQDKIIRAINTDQYIKLESGLHTYCGRTLIIASGVTDLWPEFMNSQDYIGRSIFWCITCDGCKTLGKKVVILGHDKDAACTAMQLLNFTHHVIILTNNEHNTISVTWKKRLKNKNIEIINDVLKEVKGYAGKLHSIDTEKTTIAADFIFNQQGNVPNSELAKELGVTVDNHGYIKTDHEKRTSIPYVYAAGDVTRLHSHQVVIAAAEGATAGETANYDLYDADQRWI